MDGSLRTGCRRTFGHALGREAGRAAGVAGLVLALLTGAALPARAQFYDNRAAGEANLRMEKIESQMRSLTGQIEQLGFQLKQLQDQMRRMQEDTEFRLNDLETKGAKPAPAKKTEAAPVDTGTASATALAPEAATSAPAPDTAAFNTSSPASAGEPARPLGSLPGSVAGLPAADDPNGPYGQDAGVGQPLDLTALTRGAAKPEPLPPEPVAPPGVAAAPSAPAATPGMPATGGARAAYDMAYATLMQGDYSGAEAGFRNFLTTYPRDRLAPDAQYWLGESLYGQTRYRDAADAFLKSYSDNPETPKAPDSLLKLGLSLEGLGEKDAACTTFSELLSKYPKASRTLRDRARAEMQAAGCA